MVTIDFYDILRKSGMKVESEINEWIKSYLKKQAAIRLANFTSKQAVRTIGSTRSFVETLSAMFNYPTKTDLASTTNLIKQTEEKVDQIDEQLQHLIQQSNKKNSEETKYAKDLLVSLKQEMENFIQALKNFQQSGHNNNE
ncbi:hypothetical protein J9303_03790 [Bacillaceae bacterium Marseille-Q3522]|nr:hypothetical protein [Bacillaceae bacterium Marseille-Q3522]